jgi:hypothetical protein
MREGIKGDRVNLRTPSFQNTWLVETPIASGLCKGTIQFPTPFNNQIFDVPQVDPVTLYALWHHISPFFATLWHIYGGLWSHIISGYKQQGKFARFSLLSVRGVINLNLVDKVFPGKVEVKRCLFCEIPGFHALLVNTFLNVWKGTEGIP